MRATIRVWRLDGSPINPAPFKQARSAFLDTVFPAYRASCSLDLEQSGSVQSSTTAQYKQLLADHDYELLQTHPLFIDLPLPTKKQDWIAFIAKWGPISFCVENDKLVGYLMPAGASIVPDKALASHESKEPLDLTNLLANSPAGSF